MKPRRAARRVRRSSGEVRTRALEAARKLFAEQGYAQTTTLEIARRAGVVEPTLFRHFGSKAGLLEHAFTEPFEKFVNEFLSLWEQGRAAATLQERGQDFVARTYDLLCENRDVLKVLLSVSDRDAAGGLATLLDRLFARLQSMVQTDVASFEGETKDTAARHFLRVRLTFGLIASVALLDDWLFVNAEQHPKRSTLVAALTEYIMAGISPEARHAAKPSKKARLAKRGTQARRAKRKQ